MLMVWVEIKLFYRDVQSKFGRLSLLPGSGGEDWEWWSFQQVALHWADEVVLLWARKLFEMYDDNKDGVLETITAGKMLMDLYRAMNKEFHPTATDIASYQRIFDRDNKGKITFEDMERFAVKYYCNEEWSS